jgi:hypothetical protein
VDSPQARLQSGVPRPPVAPYEGRVETVLVASDRPSGASTRWVRKSAPMPVRSKATRTGRRCTLRLGGRAYAVPHTRLPLNDKLGTQAADLFRY